MHGLSSAYRLLLRGLSMLNGESQMTSERAWEIVFNRLPDSTKIFLRDNPDKAEIWLHGFRDCARFASEELERILKIFDKKINLS